jgi:glycosyltransferase involved in cell wall biosynthesis
VIYPAIEFPPEALEPRQAGGVPRILFVGCGFWIKGGSLFLSALSELRARIEFRADFICDLPPECANYREALRGIVDFYEPNFTRPQLYQRFYRNADIFVMLGMADSYGLALLEASAFGLPIVAFRLNSGLSDLLCLSGNGVQVEPECQIFDSSGVHCMEPSELIRRIREDDHSDLVAGIAAVLGGLVSDSNRRHELGERGRDAVLNGALSPARMRTSLLDLYTQATV